MSTTAINVFEDVIEQSLPLCIGTAPDSWLRPTVSRGGNVQSCVSHCLMNDFGQMHSMPIGRLLDLLSATEAIREHYRTDGSIPDGRQ